MGQADIKLGVTGSLIVKTFAFTVLTFSLSELQILGRAINSRTNPYFRGQTEMFVFIHFYSET